jgi:hypothetical protein
MIGAGYDDRGIEFGIGQGQNIVLFSENADNGRPGLVARA